MFDALIESSYGGERRKSGTFFVSLVVHAIVLAVIVLIPLIYYQALPEHELLTFLAAPPPPPPPPAAPRPVEKVQVVRLDPNKFMAPTEVPKKIPAPVDDIPVMSTFDMSGAGVPGGVPGGVIGGVPGGISGGILGGVPGAPPPPPPPPKPKAAIRVGGNVQNSKLIQKIDPIYPELAKRARVAGFVLLQVTVDEQGTVSGIKLIRGHPLLNQSALDAVGKWRYSPTLLNGEPVGVIATVTVNFVLR
jgi:protein TonB